MVVVVDTVVVVVRGLVVSTWDISSVTGTDLTGAVLSSPTSSILLETEKHKIVTNKVSLKPQLKILKNFHFPFSIFAFLKIMKKTTFIP